MSRAKLIVPFLVIGVFLFWAVPALLKAVPDRYVMRLPEPLHSLGLPENEVAILPTVPGPAAADTLLQPEIKEEVTDQIIPSPTLRVEGIQQAPTSISSTFTPVSSSTPTPTATPSPTPWPIPAAVRLNGIQHKFQEWNNCGPATLAMALTYFGLNINQEETASVLKPNPEDRNVSPYEMADYVNDQTPFESIYRANGDLDTLRRFIANDIPVIVEVGIDPPGEFRWMGWYGHYLLVVAYDELQEQFWVYDSWFGTSEEPLQNAHPDGRILSYVELENYWSQFNNNYVALYLPEQTDIASSIIGANLDDQNMWEKSLEKNKEGIVNDADNPFLWFNLGTSYNALGLHEQAATAFDQARAIGLPWRMLWYQFSPFEAYLEVGRYEDVVLLADVTLKDRPYFEESFYYKGLALEAMGDKPGAQENFRAAIDFNPNYFPAVEALNT